jgi:hypothetical protein
MLECTIFLFHLQGELEVNSETKSLKDEESSDKDNYGREVTMAKPDGSTSPETLPLIEGGKKDPSIRRQELLVGSGLAEVCYIKISKIPFVVPFYGVSVSERLLALILLCFAEPH